MLDYEGGKQQPTFSPSRSPNPPSLGGAWRVQAYEMVKKVSKPDVQKFSGLQVNTLSRLYGLPYSSRRASVSKKAERVWGELVL